MKPTYKSPYNHALVKILNETVPYMGQSVPVLPERTSSKYVHSGNAPESLQMVKKGGALNKKKVVSKLLDIAPVGLSLATAPLGNPLLTAGIGLAAYGARKHLKKKYGYGIKETAKNAGKKVVSYAKENITPKTIISTGLDIASPAAGLAATFASGGNPLAGMAAASGTKLARNILKEYTGYGLTKDQIKEQLKYHGKKLGKATLSTALDIVPSAIGLATMNPIPGVVAASTAKIIREGIRQKTGYGMKNTLKKGTTAVLDSIPYIAGLTGDVITSNDIVGPLAYTGAKVIREGIRAKTGLGIRQKRGYGIKKKNINHVMTKFNNHDMLTKKVISHLNKHYKKKNIVGGFMDFDFEKFRKEFGSSIESYISDGLDIAIPSICEAISNYYYGNTEIGQRIGQFIRHLIKERTGYGLNKNPALKPYYFPKGEGPRVPQRRPHKEGGGAKKLNSTLQRRNNKVREVMNSMGMSWIEASKYISKNKINY